MKRISKATCLFGIGVAALVIAASACSDSIEQADVAVAPGATVATAAEGVAVSISEEPEPSVCLPGGNVVDPVRDVAEWARGEEGRPVVQLWRFRTVKTYSAEECAGIPAGGLLRARTTRQMVWERTWPDDFRAEAAELGWPADMIDRCGIGIDLAETIADHYVREACLELEGELFYGAEDGVTAGSRGLPAAAFLVRAVDLGFDADEVRRCRDQLYDYSDPAKPAAACLEMLRKADYAGGDAGAARNVRLLRCPPGADTGELAVTYTVQRPNEEGQWMIQLWQQRARPVDGAVCDATGGISAIAVKFDSDSRRMLWEKAWPDDFRADAVELGWPAGMVERCGPNVLDTSSDPVLHRICFALRAELYHETPEAVALAAEEARLNPGLHVVRPLNDGWAGEQLAACKEALFEALPRGITPRACRADAVAAAARR